MVNSNVPQKMLIQPLRELQKDEIVLRTVFPEVSPKVEYSLTFMGHLLRPTFTTL